LDREPKLVRHKSGRYYARTFNNNKEIWKKSAHDHLRRQSAMIGVKLSASSEMCTITVWKSPHRTAVHWPALLAKFNSRPLRA